MIPTDCRRAVCPVLRAACAGLALVVGWTIVAGVAAGADFRVTNRVYAGSDQKPQSQGTTIFYGGRVYDFLDEPAEVIVLDKAAGRFTLLDDQHRVRAELTPGEVAAFVARIKQRAAAHQDPLVRFLATPSFAEEFSSDPARNNLGTSEGDSPIFVGRKSGQSPGGFPADPKDLGQLTLRGQWMTYRVRLSAADAEVARQYREFSDWQVRLNVVLFAGARPPFARLMLNEAIARRQAIPREVWLSTEPGGPAKATASASQQGGGLAKATIMHSEHELLLPPGAADVERVAAVRESMRTFQAVAFEQYRRGVRR
ncbi:MAG: hypothetical protein ABSF26_14490 [Thermoguttaceae bacterium]|jgi:hypothetical protein